MGKTSKCNSKMYTQNVQLSVFLKWGVITVILDVLILGVTLKLMAENKTRVVINQIFNQKISPDSQSAQTWLSCVVVHRAWRPCCSPRAAGGREVVGVRITSPESVFRVCGFDSCLEAVMMVMQGLYIFLCFLNISSWIPKTAPNFEL